MAISTILRNKKDLTVIMMGNLQNNITSVPILNYYGIDIGDNLRIVKRTMGNSTEACTILYVNSGSLYNNSIKNQAAVAHHSSLDDRLFMEHNKVINSNIKVLNSNVVSKMESLCSIGLEYKEEFFAVEIRGVAAEKSNLIQDEVFALCVYPLTITTALKTEIMTHDPLVSNKFTNVTYRKNMRSIYKFIYKLFTCNSLYYDNANSLDMAG